ncbi:MAG: hypothetical protein B7X99_18530 [Rhizobiales bacterium 17-65-6]|nr:MAG: hypothetical protein B7X99_18530 [Rhizobiales bacterium 17-65-6]
MVVSSASLSMRPFGPSWKRPDRRVTVISSSEEAGCAPGLMSVTVVRSMPVPSSRSDTFPVMAVRTPEVKSRSSAMPRAETRAGSVSRVAARVPRPSTVRAMPATSSRSPMDDEVAATESVRLSSNAARQERVWTCAESPGPSTESAAP